MMPTLRKQAIHMYASRAVIGKRWIAAVILAGAVYFALMAARLILGLTILSSSVWFATWIPAVFHLVLASEVLLVGGYARGRINETSGGR